MFSPKILRYFGIFTITRKPETAYTDYRIYTVFCACNFATFRRLLGNMNAPIEFRRRIGRTPQQNGVQCGGCYECPDVWELADGDFAVIGEDITAAARATLPAVAGCGPNERIIRLPRVVLVNAKRDIPDCI